MNLPPSNKWLYKFRTYFIFTLLNLFMSLAIIFDVVAIGIYQKCIYGATNSGNLPNVVLVRTVGQQCYNICQQECGKAFDIDLSSKSNSDSKENKSNQDNNQQNMNDYSSVLNTISINRDQIERCIKTCQQGNIFSGEMRQYDENSSTITPFSTITTVSTKAACNPSSTGINSANYAGYNADIYVEEGDSLDISLVNPSAMGLDVQGILKDDQDNTLYMCNYNTVYIYPYFYTTDSKFTTSPDPWANIAKPQTPNDPSNPSASWVARNYVWTDTGIMAKNGDYLSIGYYGRFHYICSEGTAKCDMPCYTDDYVPGCNRNSLYDYSLQIKDPTQTNIGWSTGTGDYYVLPGQNLMSHIAVVDIPKNAPPQTINTYSILQQSDSTANSKLLSIFGLKPFLVSQSTPQIFLADNQGSPINSSSIVNDVNYNYNTTFFRSQLFNGVLSKFSSTFSQLGIKHYDEMPQDNWLDNVGGYNVVIIWKGCQVTGGNNLQYTIVPDEYQDNAEFLSTYLTNNSNWLNFPAFNSSGVANLVITASDLSIASNAIGGESVSGGYLFFRINTITSNTYNNWVPSNCGTSDLKCQVAQSFAQDPNLYARYNTTGQYNLVVQKSQPNNQDCGPLASIILKLCTMINGSSCDLGSQSGSEKTGAVQEIYQNMIKNSTLINAVRALLILYIAYSSLNFMLGISPISQKEVVVRLFKIAIVLILISDNSWNFFNQYLFVLFTNGTQELIQAFSYYNAPKNSNSCISWLPVLAQFDSFIAQLFSPIISTKILALVLNGLLGFTVALVLIIAMVICFICILKAVLIYLVSIIAIGVLMLLAPLFISFILFNYTRQMFDAWLKQVTSFALQPVLAFASISLFLQLIMVLFQMAMNFTVCLDCLISFTLPPIIDFCFFHIYRPINLVHSPDPFSGPISTLTLVICFLILSQAMYAFSDFVVNIANNIISYTASSLSEVSKAPAISNTLQLVKSIVVSPANLAINAVSSYKSFGDKKKRGGIEGDKQDEKSEDSDKKSSEKDK